MEGESAYGVKYDIKEEGISLASFKHVFLLTCLFIVPFDIQNSMMPWAIPSVVFQRNFFSPLDFSLVY